MKYRSVSKKVSGGLPQKAAIGLSVLTLVAAACGSAQTKSTSSATSKTSATTSTSASSKASATSGTKKAVTLTFVVQGPLTGPGGQMYKTLAAEFNKAYAPVSVRLVPEAQAQIEATELTSIKSSNPPDMIYWPVGAGYGETTAAKSGLLANLLPLYKQQGWLKVMPPSMTQEEINGGLYNVDGTLGAQPYVFYNESIFKKLGLTPPHSVAGLSAVASKLRAAGVTPLGLGTVHHWPAVHLVSILTERTLPITAYENLLYSWRPTTSHPTSWTDPRVVKAFTVLQDWAKAGLFPKGSSALSNSETMTLFEQGKVAMDSCPIGCFAPPTITKYIGNRFKVGMFQYPAISSGIPLYQNVAVANQEFSVPENAWKKHQSAITDFIKFWNSLQARKTFAKAGNMPDNTQGLSTTFISQNVGPFNVQVLRWMKKYGTEQNLDGWLAAPLRRAVAIQAQDVIAGSTTPTAACAALQTLAAKLHSGKAAP